MDIRNFCIIAHIDHGKSTLADRMLEKTGTVELRQMKEQLLDSMDLERERGITIKLQPVRMQWRGKILNLIDTPGHVDFQYEVSRSLQAVEGAVLLVDATQGVQAQTLANLYLALEQDLTIIPVINKIDLPAADVQGVSREISNILGGTADEILCVSAKTGAGVEEILDEIVKRVPPAGINTEKPLRALIFDSVYDDYKGVVAYVRVVEGEVRSRDQLFFIGTEGSDKVVETGIFDPAWQARSSLQAGEIGYIATGLKDVRQARVGDTITRADLHLRVDPLPGFSIPQPKVFAGIFPSRGEDFSRLREAMESLTLNDSSLQVTVEQSAALGQGFRCGFLGMLHMEIVQERLRREYDLDLVMTTPSVQYQITKSNGQKLLVETPAQFPDPAQIEQAFERYARVDILTPAKQLGPVFELLQEREGVLIAQEHLEGGRVKITYDMPLRELVLDLYDQLKSATSGYGSLSYELTDWREADVVKLSVLINHEAIEALSVISARKKATGLGRRMVAALKNVIPRQQFTVPIQAAIGGQIVARETLPALRKDVTAKLYGGDVTRKRKLLDRQKKGKKKLAGQGSIDIPPEAYLAVFRRN